MLLDRACIAHWNVDIALSIHSFLAFWTMKSVLHEEVTLLNWKKNLQGRLFSAVGLLLNYIVEFILMIFVLDLNIHPFLALPSLSL